MSDRLLKESDVLKAIDKRVEELSKDPEFVRKNGIIDIMGVKKHILAIPSPQRDCFLCKWLGDVDVCGRCRNRNLFAEADTEPTIFKMEQVDKDINVRSKTEPSNSEKPNNCETCRFELYCPEMCEGCCEWDSHYEPRDEPQMERHLPDYSYEADLGRRIMEQMEGNE